MENTTMKKILLGLSALCLSVSVVAADDYVNFQMVDDYMGAHNILTTNDGILINQDAINVGNQAKIVDTDAFNDSYVSRQILNDDMVATNKLDLDDDADKVNQVAANAINDLVLRDNNGVWWAGTQDVTSRQSTYDDMWAENEVDAHRIDKLDMVAANSANSVDIRLDHSNGNIVDVVSSQYLGDSQLSYNNANIDHSNKIGQVAQNVANTVMIKH
jgi:hypothetical protein